MSAKSFFTRLLSISLHWQILAAMVVGLLTAMLCRDVLSLESGLFVSGSKSLGALFLRLLKMVIVPLVMSSIIVGVANVGDPKNLGRMGIKTMGYYMVTSLFAIMIGLVLTGLIRPGAGVEMGGSEVFDQESLNTPGSPYEILMRMIPVNPIGAMVEGDMLAIIFFALLLGVAITHLPENHRRSLSPLIDAFFHAMMRMTTGIIRLAPLGVYGLIFRAWMELPDKSLFQAIGTYMATIALGLTVHLLVVLPSLFFLMTRRNPIRHFRNMLDAMLTAFSTSSSSATLPVTLECTEKNAGVENRVSSFVLPLGATINMDGTALYECAGVLFIAQVLGIDLSLGQQLTVILTALLASIGAAGIPSAGLVMIFIVLEAVGIQGEQVGLIVGTMLAVDRPLDMYRTVVNIFSDSVATVIVAHSEDAIQDDDHPGDVVTPVGESQAEQPGT